MYTMFHILWCFHNVCSLSFSKLPLYYLYSNLVNPLWDGLLEHDINFKTCNSITLRGLFNLTSTVMGHVVIGILNKYNIFNWKMLIFDLLTNFFWKLHHFENFEVVGSHNPCSPLLGSCSHAHILALLHIDM